MENINEVLSSRTKLPWSMNNVETPCRSFAEFEYSTFKRQNLTPLFGSLSLEITSIVLYSLSSKRRPLCKV